MSDSIRRKVDGLLEGLSLILISLVRPPPPPMLIPRRLGLLRDKSR